MRLDAWLNENDAKFVDATLNEVKRRERIERLSRNRRMYYIIIVIQLVCIGLTTLLDVFSRFSPQAKVVTSSSTPLWSLFVLFAAYYFYYDLQIKFLKAGAATKANANG